MGSIGSNVGYAIGSFFGGPIGGAPGSFIGKVLGTLFGNFFGSKKPKVPEAQANLTLNFTDGQFVAGTATSANSGNEDLVSRIARAAANTVNGFIGVLMAGDDQARIVNTGNLTQTYGHGGAHAQWPVLIRGINNNKAQIHVSTPVPEREKSAEANDNWARASLVA